MCDPVPSHPVSGYSCIDCGSQVAVQGNLRCDKCRRRATDFEKTFQMGSPALTPTGAAPSNPAVDPGLQSDRWSLHQQQFGGPHAGKLKKVGQSLDPKDLKIEVRYPNSHTVRVNLYHKPTGIFAEESGPADQKEAIHTRLYGELKGKVEKLQADVATIEQAFKTNWAFHAFNRFVTLRMETKTPGFCDGPKYSEREAFAIAIVGLARTVPADKEAAAKAIYRLFPDADGHPWVEGGNSLKQDDARRYAAAALSVAEARSVPEPTGWQQLQLWHSVERLVASFEKLVVEELSGTHLYDEHMHLADKVRQLMASPVPDTPEQPSSQVHPDSGLPSKVQQ